jgi:hypothetical protein
MGRANGTRQANSIIRSSVIASDSGLDSASTVGGAPRAQTEYAEAKLNYEESGQALLGVEQQLEALEAKRFQIANDRADYYAFTVIPKSKLADWEAAGFSPEDGERWEEAIGTDPEAAKEWMERGATAEDVGRNIREAENTVRQNTYGSGRGGRFGEYKRLSVSRYGVEPWLRHGFDVDDIPKWIKPWRIETAEDAAQWRDAGFSATELARWSAGYPLPDDVFFDLNPEQAAKLKAAGVKPGDTKTYKKLTDDGEMIPFDYSSWFG